MKPHIVFGLAFILIVLFAALLGCKTWSKEMTCATASTAYQVYLAIIEANGKPNADQIAAAKAAAAFLNAYCAPTARGVGMPGDEPYVDRNGVLIMPWFHDRTPP